MKATKKDSSNDSGKTLPDMPVLDFKKPAAEHIFEALKTAILLSKLEPGRLISENEVGKFFGASRTPVREAFARLRSDNLIVTRPSRCSFVSKLSEKQIRSTQFIREALEVATVTLLCKQGLSAQANQKIQATLIAQEQALNKCDPIGFQQHDDDFHAALAEATGLERINDLLMREKMTLDRLRVLTLNDESHKAVLFEDHQAVYQAISKGDADAATAHMRRHLGRVLTTLSNLRQEHHAYFD